MNDVPYFSQRLSGSNFSAEGFPSLEEAISWSQRICGLACLKMAASRLTGRTPSLYELLQLGLTLNAYSPGKGWVHAGLVDMARKLEMVGESISIGDDLARIDCHIHSGALVIASVSGGLDESVRGGHLVVVFDLRPDAFLLHHPSAWPEYEWSNLWVSREKFRKCMSERGNIIVLSNRVN